MNEVSRFVFEERQLRGGLVRLSETWQRVIARHDYPDSVQNLLGEAVAATVLMGVALKGGTRVSMLAVPGGQAHLRHSGHPGSGQGPGALPGHRAPGERFAARVPGSLFSPVGTTVDALAVADQRR